MKFDQFDSNTNASSISEKELQVLKEEIASLRKDIEECGKGISALIDALYTESGNLRDFSDTQTRNLTQSALKALQELPKEIRINAKDVKTIQDLISIGKEGITYSLLEEDKVRITNLEKDLKKIRDYFWWVFYGVALIFIMLGVWTLKVILVTLGQWIIN